MAATTSFTLSKLFLKPSTPNTRSLFTLKKSNLFSFCSQFTPLPLKLNQPLHYSTTTPRISATISVNDKLPNSTLSYFDSSNELKTLSITDLTHGKKTVLFAVPGAFTPTCSQKHLPGFVEKSKDLKAKGVDTIACISVNDAFVMKSWKENLGINDEFFCCSWCFYTNMFTKTPSAIRGEFKELKAKEVDNIACILVNNTFVMKSWKENLGINDEVMMLSDGNMEFTKAIGCEIDLSDKPVGLGVRSTRYSMLVEDGIVKILNLEEGGAFNVSSAEDILKAL